MHTWLINVQHLYFHPVAEHIFAQVVIHSAHVELSFCGSDGQVCSSGTKQLENKQNNDLNYSTETFMVVRSA